MREFLEAFCQFNSTQKQESWIEWFKIYYVSNVHEDLFTKEMAYLQANISIPYIRFRFLDFLNNALNALEN